MKRHAKAASAGSTLSRGIGLGSIRLAFATRGASRDDDGSGARSFGGARFALGLIAAILVLAPGAFAAPQVPGGAPVATFGPSGLGSCAGSALATGSGDLTSGSTEVANVSTGCGTFAAGQVLEGTGIQPKTKITAVGAGTLTLSNAATATAVGVQLSATSSFSPPFAAAGNPTQLAFNQASHRLYAFDKVGQTVYAFNSPSITGSISGFPLTVPAGPFVRSDIAVDNTESPSVSAGRFYYAESRFKTLYAYNPAGTELKSPSFPNFPIGFSQELCGAAVDSTGNLYVGDESVVRKYSPSGALLTTLPVSHNAGPCELAFDSNNDLFVADSGASGPGAVYKYTAASGYSAESATLVEAGDPFGRPTALAVDTSRHQLYVVHSKRVVVYQASDGSFVGNFATGIAGESLFGVAVDQSNGKVYVSDAGNEKVDAFNFLPLPEIAPGGADGISPTTAILHYTVNPQGAQVTDCHFQYTTDAEYQLNGFTYAITSNCNSNPGSGSSAVGIATGLAGLTAGTDYRFRFIAANANGASTGPPLAFSTAGPQVRRSPASSISDTAATLNAQVKPNGEGTSYRFQYVSEADFEQSGYGNATSVPASPVGIGNGNAYVSVSQAVSGLSPDTGYHFRAVASNASATVTGPDTGFATPPTPPSVCPNPFFHTGIAGNLPNCRAYEQASPLDKNGYDIAFYSPVLATPDGEKVAYNSILGAFSEPSSGSYTSDYIGTRGSSWQSENVVPPALPFLIGFTGEAIGISGDFSKQLVVTNGKLTEDGQLEDPNQDPTQELYVYVHDSSDGSYQLITAGGPGVSARSFLGDSSVGAGVVGASRDGSHFYLRARDKLPSTPPGNGIYDATEGELRLAAPNGYPAVPRHSGSHWDGQGVSAASFHSVSEDGRRLYWSSAPPSHEGILYLTEDDGEKTVVSKRQSDGTTQNGEFQYATPQGTAFFTSSARLTADASSKGADLYRYEPDSQQLTDLTPDSIDPSGAGVQMVLGTSEDGSYVYFLANGRLAPGAPAPGTCTIESSGSAANNGCSIYAWHDGTIRLVDTLASWAQQFTGPHPCICGPATDEVNNWRVSANGRYLGFLFGGQLSGPSPYGALPVNPEAKWPFRHAYLYDYRADRLECASCLPGGADPGGEPGINLKAWSTSTIYLSSSQNMARAVSNRGQFFFDTADALVPADANGKRDVYQYTAGQSAQLISSGQGNGDSFFGDASVSGSDVFFVTHDGLVGQDTDPNYDLYDAREGGGLASQSTNAQGATCQGDGCQGAFTTPPGGPGAGTAAFSGPGNPKPKRTKAHKHKRHAKHNHKRAANNKRRAGR